MAGILRKSKDCDAMKKRGDIYADLEFSDDHSAPTAPPVAPPPVTKRKANGADGPPQVEHVLTAAVVEAEKPEPCSEVAEEDDAPPRQSPPFRSMWSSHTTAARNPSFL